MTAVRNIEIIAVKTTANEMTAAERRAMTVQEKTVAAVKVNEEASIIYAVENASAAAVLFAGMLLTAQMLFNMDANRQIFSMLDAGVAEMCDSLCLNIGLAAFAAALVSVIAYFVSKRNVGFLAAGGLLLAAGCIVLMILGRVCGTPELSNETAFALSRVFGAYSAAACPALIASGAAAISAIAAAKYRR